MIQKWDWRVGELYSRFVILFWWRVRQRMVSRPGGVVVDKGPTQKESRIAVPDEGPASIRHYGPSTVTEGVNVVCCGRKCRKYGTMSFSWGRANMCYGLLWKAKGSRATWWKRRSVTGILSSIEGQRSSREAKQLPTTLAPIKVC